MSIKLLSRNFIFRIAAYMAADKKARDEAKAAKKAEARRYREEQERLAQGST